MPLFEFLKEEMISEAEARATTEPYWAELTTVWCSAWERWGKMDEDDRRRLGETPCTPPVVLNAFAQSFAREVFSGREDEGLVVCDVIPNVFAFYINQRVLLRFNSLGADFVVHNTDRSPLKDDYFRQEPIYGIENAATRLTVGYLANEAKVEMACVAISLQFGPTPVYHFLIQSEEGALPIPAPVVPPQPAMPSEQRPNRKAR
jgi:hypothetical protein